MTWSIREVEGKWCVARFMQECMRIDSHGTLSIGKGPLQWGTEFYQFDTEEYALAQLKFCESTDRIWSNIFAHSGSLVFTTHMFVGEGSGTVVVRPSYDTFRIQAPGAEPLFAVDQHGRVTHFDLPKFVWAWINSTLAARLVKAFWYGWGK